MDVEQSAGQAGDGSGEGENPALYLGDVVAERFDSLFVLADPAKHQSGAGLEQTLDSGVGHDQEESGVIVRMEVVDGSLRISATEKGS